MARIARFAFEGRTHYGLVQDDETLRLLSGDLFGKWQPTNKVISLAQAKLLAPVEPPNILAVGLNYRLHAQESGMALPKHPAIFIKPTTAVCGPNDTIVLPRVAPNEVDYECELVIVIGKRARHVSEADAHDYVLGYTCGNDVSARDVQLRLDPQWARGKSFDTFAPLGPWLQTELDPDNTGIRSRVNGKVMQDSNTNDFVFNTRQVIAFLSDAMTLLPGTVILTGTPGGVGFARKPPVFLRPGDVVEIEVDGIGTLRNSVVAEP